VTTPEAAPTSQVETIPDSSVLIAGYLRTHEFHTAAVTVLADVRQAGRLLGHTMAETYAVLTAPAGPYAVPGDSVVRYVERLAQREPAWLPAPRYTDALAELARLGIGGGAIYDGLIAFAAREIGGRLVSLDRRAAPTYRRLGAEHRLLV
jgi:toxin FitB